MKVQKLPLYSKLHDMPVKKPKRPVAPDPYQKRVTGPRTLAESIGRPSIGPMKRTGIYDR